MNDYRYYFGYSLRQTLEKGEDYKTKLRETFEKIITERTGLQVKHSDFDSKIHQPCLFLEVDIKCSPAMKKEDYGVIDGVFYPNENMKQNILDCFNNAAVDCGLPPFDFSESTMIMVEDYYSTAQSIFFNINIYDLDMQARRHFPDIKFMLRWVWSDTSQYYLIFTYKEDEVKAGEIAEFVNSICKAEDKLGIFDVGFSMPIITTKQELQDRGLVMGIMRNNTDFTDW